TVSVATNLVSPNFKVNIKADGLNYNGALVAINQNNVLKTSGYSDSVGNFIFNSALVAEAVPVNIVVTGKNLLPYDGLMTITSINNISEIADSYSLDQNYPNPFNPTTNINFSIPKNSFVTLQVYDVTGKEIQSLVNDNLNAGVYSFNFNAGDLSSGIYFYKIIAGDYSDIKKMTLLK
ncbi:MAG: T9SS type A sorting domain-containing protein, partial [bacterium]